MASNPIQIPTIRPVAEVEPALILSLLPGDSVVFAAVGCKGEVNNKILLKNSLQYSRFDCALHFPIKPRIKGQGVFKRFPVISFLLFLGVKPLLGYQKCRAWGSGHLPPKIATAGLC